MRLLIGLLLAFAVAASVGLGTTLLALQEGTPFGSFTVGAWTAWPRTGTSDIDPYARALIARSGELPMGAGDGVAFIATKDDTGSPLDGRCDVVVSGLTPQARFWTLTLYDPDGKLVGNSLRRYGFSSQEVVRNSDGSIEILVAPSRAFRQLAAERRHRALYTGVALLRLSGRGRLTNRPRNADALDQGEAHAHEVPRHDPLAVMAVGRSPAGRIVHFATVLYLPNTATQNAYARISAISPVEPCRCRCRCRARKNPCCR